MNQVEIWLSILVRKLLKRGNFTSLDNLRDQILAFIAYYNRTDGQAHQMDVHGAFLIMELLLPLCTRVITRDPSFVLQPYVPLYAFPLLAM